MVKYRSHELRVLDLMNEGEICSINDFQGSSGKVQSYYIQTRHQIGLDWTLNYATTGTVLACF